MTRTVFPLLLFMAGTAGADEAAVRRLLQDKMRDVPVDSVQKLPNADLYEVVLRGPQGPVIYHVDGNATLIIAGLVVDAKTGRNLTRERERKLNSIPWSTLPFDDAVTTVRGDGRRKIAVFSDRTVHSASASRRTWRSSTTSPCASFCIR